MRNVKIKIYTPVTGFVKGVLTDAHSPRTFKVIIEALPLESIAMRWGDELYFETPIVMEEENAKSIVDKGIIAYWPPGNSICIFWGPTPISKRPNEIRPASPVNIIGKIIDDPLIFSSVKSGTKIRIEKAD